MTAKVLLTSIFIGMLTLAGCGNNDQQNAAGAKSTAASANTPAAPEVTTVVAEDKIQLIGADVLAAAQRTGDTCSLDSVDGNYSRNQVKLAEGKPHVFRGWLLDEAKHPAGQFSLVLKGAQDFEILVSTGVVRTDVGEFFKDPTLGDAGFNFSSALASVKAGDYHVIYMTKNSEKTYFCDTGKTLTIE
ncbi:hypothetical protein GCM10008098_01470 [Rhodanobacter panaciterrae]|uniref:Lipoprotein n=1 Tax=Rhodanobacter panaciterrae TaxID=490572 RepID=A0ABQ2ZGC9_9GAMM|nr:hypothetical protein [Rhodanobacter panaciterrae]GGY14385.1 hypothetical protein GCM10008098_01470 [Rhodanobacter panaciterrae]